MYAMIMSGLGREDADGASLRPVIYVHADPLLHVLDLFTLAHRRWSNHGHVPGFPWTRCIIIAGAQPGHCWNYEVS